MDDTQYFKIVLRNTQNILNKKIRGQNHGVSWKKKFLFIRGTSFFLYWHQRFIVKESHLYPERKKKRKKHTFKRFRKMITGTWNSLLLFFYRITGEILYCRSYLKYQWIYSFQKYISKLWGQKTGVEIDAILIFSIQKN